MNFFVRTIINQKSISRIRNIRLFSNGEISVSDRHVILSHALKLVPQYGWSLQAIQGGAKAAGLPGVAHGLFPGGGADLIEYFEDECNQELNEYLREMSTNEDRSLRGGALVQRAVERRLRMLIPYMETWPEANFIKATPYNLTSSLERLATMVDDIWYHCGDRSTDFNWYTKRGILAAVYCSTELYMIQDNSVDFQDTWSFMSRRFEDTKTVTRSRKQFDEFVGGAFNLGVAAFTTMQNVLGLNSRGR